MRGSCQRLNVTQPTAHDGRQGESRQEKGSRSCLCGLEWGQPQSTVAPDDLTTGAQAATSDLMKAPNCSGVFFSATAPSFS